MRGARYGVAILNVAYLLDLAGAKASVIQVRAEAKNYVDIDALMRLGDIGLPHYSCPVLPAFDGVNAILVATSFHSFE